MPTPFVRTITIPPLTYDTEPLNLHDCRFVQLSNVGPCYVRVELNGQRDCVVTLLAGLLLYWRRDEITIRSLLFSNPNESHAHIEILAGIGD